MTPRPVTPRDFGAVMPDFDGRSILLTGGTGSFGRKFVRAVLHRFKPKRLVIYSRDEMKQHDMQIEFAAAPGRESLRFFIGDVRDRDRLELAMRGIDYVIHAAALKHVPAAEYNPMECIRTNVYGAENVVFAALRSGTPRVLALSTDKAANPVNLYGATKLAADKTFIAANHLSGDRGTRFSVVRYGNVLGSRGSVVPYFMKLLKDGAASLPITDPRMTRFWITLDQGVNFVFSSLAMMRGGEIFVPKIPSMLLSSLVEALRAGMPTHTIGIRPGEKLHEVLITEDDSRTAVELPDRYVLLPPPTIGVSFADSLELASAVPVREGFRYTSDSNPEWLDVAGMRALLDGIGHG
ncbi:MAG: UDP-N-acetylglucosamine 4,6-dehydratase (inverting) [Alphaproteobacteria bacterium]|nr:UDP-N-acetylglucosamine 4,6-dehydratase (inverting) [Alphaproteobacteria bacterium]